MTVLGKLLKYPHAAAFDKDPHRGLALRVRSHGGMRWSVADGILVIGDHHLEHTFDLSGLSIGELAGQLTAIGFEVDMPGTFADHSALVLVEGEGGEHLNNGDRLFGFGNLLWSILGAYGREIQEAEHQAAMALRQMVIPDSEGDWLSLWARLYDQVRRDGETDQELAEKIPREAFRIRVNKYAIEKAILDLTGKVVTIEEPFSSIFRLDTSALSGGDRFFDGSETGPFLIRPVSAEAIDWADVLPVIERNRASGVIVLAPETRYHQLLDLSIDGTVISWMTNFYAAWVRMWDEGRLDYMALSMEEYTINYGTSISSVMGMTNMRSVSWISAGGHWDDRIWGNRDELDGLLDPLTISAYTQAAGTYVIGVSPAWISPAIGAASLSTMLDAELDGTGGLVLATCASISAFADTPVSVSMSMTGQDGRTWNAVEYWDDEPWQTPGS